MDRFSDNKVWAKSGPPILLDIKQEEPEYQSKSEIIQVCGGELEYNYDLQDNDCDPLKVEKVEPSDPVEKVEYKIEGERSEGLLLLVNGEELVMKFEYQESENIVQEVQFEKLQAEIKFEEEFEIESKNDETQSLQSTGQLLEEKLELGTKREPTEADLIIEDWQESHSDVEEEYLRPSAEDNHQEGEELLFEEPEGLYSPCVTSISSRLSSRITRPEAHNSDQQIASMHRVTLENKRCIKYTCLYCPFYTNIIYRLVKHMECHKGEKLFACPLCPCRVKNSFSLKVHMSIHIGKEASKINIYKCLKCPFKCRKKKDLKNHTQSHKVKCTLCPYEFQWGENTYAHTVTHFSQVLKCSLCPYEGKQPNDLKEHIQSHVTELWLRCKFCSYTCKSERTLMLHMALPHLLPAQASPKGDSCLDTQISPNHHIDCTGITYTIPKT